MDTNAKQLVRPIIISFLGHDMQLTSSQGEIG